MKIEVEGKEIDVEVNESIIEKLRSEPLFNAEVDRVKDKSVEEASTALTSKYDTDFNNLKTTHAKALEDAQTMASGQVSEQMKVLIDANKETAETVKQLKLDLKTEKESGTKSVLKSELAGALGGVSDELVRNTLIEQGMKSAVVDEDGKAYFKGADGVMSGSKDMVTQFSAQYPQHFDSKQPNGTSVVGGKAKVVINATEEQKRVQRVNEKFKK